MQANKMPQESNNKIEGGGGKEIKIPTAKYLWNLNQYSLLSSLKR